MSKERAWRELNAAFNNWYYESGQDVPSIGILLIGLSHEGCDLQYMGKEPNVVVDWPTLFANIIQELERGTYRIDMEAGVPFHRPWERSRG